MRRIGILALALWTAHALTNSFAAIAAGQAATTHQSITGTVKDALGRPLVDADLVIETPEGKIVARTRTDKDGHFSFARIASGSYAIVTNKTGFHTAATIVAIGPAMKPIEIALEAEAALSLPVTVKRIDQARNAINPATGGSAYTFTAKAIQQLPQGSNSSMSSVLLQAPGVAQDSFGQVHIRGEHGDLQYRINGVELPEGVTSGFSQTFGARFAQRVSLLEGALPAQYGYHTAGVVQIQTKSGDDFNGADIDMYGGQRYTLNPSFEIGQADGKFSYYATGFYLQNDRGLEPPTPGPQALHDFTTIGNGFTYLQYQLAPTTRISFIGGFNVANFQIPANPNQTPAFQLAGVPDLPSGLANFPSANIRETQLEQNYFGVLAAQGTLLDAIDYEVAGFSRYSTLSFHPDQQGDLIYNGVASRVFRGDWASGLQGDFAYSALETHTLRAGFYFSGERAEIDNHSLAFPGGVCPPAGVAPVGPCVPGTVFQTSDQPDAIVDDTALTAWNYGLYLEDEWHPFKHLTINYGARFDLYDGLTRSDQVSPRAGFVYQLFPATTLHAAYARYFTPPPLEAVSGEDLQKFKGTTNEPAVTTDANIAPERAHYFDAGVGQTLPYGIKVDLDSYYKKSTDLIDEGQFGPTLVFTPFNYAKGRQYGVELTTSLNRGNFSSYANFAYGVAQGNDIVSDQFLFSAAELTYIKDHYVFLDHDQTFSESAGVAYSWRGLLLSLDNLYGSGLRSGFANTGNQPFYVQFDAGIAKELTLTTIGKVTGRIAVVNLGDWIYPIRSGSGIGVFAPQYGPRRTFYGGFNWEIPFFNRQGAIH